MGHVGITAPTRLPGANGQFDHLLFLEPLQLPAEAADPRALPAFGPGEDYGSGIP